MNKYGLVVCFALFFNVVTFAGEVRSVDVMPLDIAGIKLGMSKKEAFSAVSNKLGLKKEDIKKFTPNIYSVKYKNDKIVINFTPTTLDPDAPMAVVSGITYQTPNTSANNELMRKNVLEKYGQATMESCGTSPCYVLTWCTGVKGNCDMEQGMLSYAFNKLQLITMKYQTALRKLRDKQQTGAAAF